MDQKQKENWVQHLGLFNTVCHRALSLRIYPTANKAQFLIPAPSYPCQSWGRWCLWLGHQSWYPEGYSVPNLCHLCRFSISLTCLMQKGSAGLTRSGAGCRVLGVCGSGQLCQPGGFGATLVKCLNASELVGSLWSCRWLCKKKKIKWNLLSQRCLWWVPAGILWKISAVSEDANLKKVLFFLLIIDVKKIKQTKPSWVLMLVRKRVNFSLFIKKWSLWFFCLCWNMPLFFQSAHLWKTVFWI